MSDLGATRQLDKLFKRDYISFWHMLIMKGVFMPRPCKFRFVRFPPDYYCFKPIGVPSFLLEEVSLYTDEMEALRLADYEGLYQEEAAKIMGVSRQTFGNIISSAREKVVDFLINGKLLKIEGGKVMTEERIFKCFECGSEWSVPFGEQRPERCPKCSSQDIERVEVQSFQKEGSKKIGMRQGRGMGQGKRCQRGMGKFSRGMCRGSGSGKRGN